jgi:hypothetical protein
MTDKGSIALMIMDSSMLSQHSYRLLELARMQWLQTVYGGRGASLGDGGGA